MKRHTSIRGITRKIIIRLFGSGIFAFLLLQGCKSRNEISVQSVAAPVNTWVTTGYGGGGAMFYPAVSPHNSNYAFVACDMTGTYVTYNGGESWRMFSLRGPVKYFVFDPLNSDVVYAKSIALFKSTDRGHTWNIFYPAPSEVKGIISKGDHAEERIVTNDSTRRQVLAFAVDPADSKKLHAAIEIDDSLAYYFSDNDGLSWTKLKPLQDNARNIFIDPSSPEDNRTIYITGNNSVILRENGVWRSHSGPEKVQRLNEYSGGYDKDLKKYIIYAISGKSYFNPEDDQSGIYYTENGGETWENRQTGLSDLRVKDAEFPEYRTVATSSHNPGVVYVSYAGLKVHADTTCLGVAKSEDFGRTWTLPWKDRLSKDTGIYSSNYLKGWIDERFNPTWGENPFSIGVSPVDPDICYTTDFGRTIKTTDGGGSWKQVYTEKKQGAGWKSRGLEVTTGYSIVFDPFDTSHVFIANTDIGLMESRDGGESWLSATINNGIPRKWVNSTYWLTFDPDVKGRAWAAMSSVHDLPRPKMWRRMPVSKFTGGLLITEDGGKSWREISNDIGEAAFTHIFVDTASPAELRILYACAFGKGVYKSVDGGKSWKQKNNGLSGKEPFAWRIVKDSSGTLYLTVNRRSDNGSIGNELDGALYRSEDSAGSWIRMSLPDGTNGPTSIAIDPFNSSRLVISAWGRPTRGEFSNDTGGGIFLSEDKGLTWSQVLKKDQHIHDITVDPRNKAWYACGFNGSAYRSDDDGKSWNRIKGYNFKWGKRVDPDPRDPEKIFVITFGGGVFHGPARGVENAVEDIVTPVLVRK